MGTLMDRLTPQLLFRGLLCVYSTINISVNKNRYCWVDKVVHQIFRTNQGVVLEFWGLFKPY